MTLKPQGSLHVRVEFRCYNKSNIRFNDYGGRGILVYPPWKDDPKLFYNYLLTLPETREQFEARTGEISTIDRIDVNGNYEPGNIRFASNSEQQQNKRNNVLTEQLVKLILWEYEISNKSIMDILRILTMYYNFTGTRHSISKVINRITWTDINIDKEIAEFRAFGTVNGVVII